MNSSTTVDDETTSALDDRMFIVERLSKQTEARCELDPTPEDVHYRVTISEDSTLADCIALGSHLAQLGRYSEALLEFSAALNSSFISGHHEALTNIVHLLASIHNRSEDFAPVGGSQPSSRSWHDGDEEDATEPEADEPLASRFEVAKTLTELVRQMIDDAPAGLAADDLRELLEVLADLDDAPLDKIGGVVTVYRRHRAAARPREVGLDLLKLALLFGECGWCRIEVACIRRAIHCFDQVASRSATAAVQSKPAILQLGR